MYSRPPSALDWLLLFILAVVWGASFLFIKKSVAIFTPTQMAMWRMVLATAIYLPVAALYWSKIDWKRWKPLVVVAFCGSAIPNFLFAVAQQHVDSSLAGVLNSLTPLFTLILGVAFFEMKFSGNKILGVIMGLAGAAILILFNSKSGMSGNAFYTSLCALATICYAINANSVNTWLRDQHPAAIASAAFVLTGWMFGIGLWLSGGWEAAWKHERGLEGLGYIGYLALLGTVGGSILYFWLLQRTSAIFATSVTYLLPVAAIVLGAFDGEVIGWLDLLGTAVILTGLYIARK
ncbi:MAG: EamA/RhaT family transporter [Haliscomenobacteraceae bacterium CHB4]|nr:putative inner membrane transporter YedA [Saprospiraceae bacterium]MCE7923350.1 EamA/RhaT family transporter [Haliscomenobacteraceae bacterium CHB4]